MACPWPVHSLLCDDDGVVGTMFYIMDYVEGRSFWEPWLPDLAPAERRAFYAEMGRVIARLHQIDHVAAGLEDFGRPNDYVVRQVANAGRSSIARRRRRPSRRWTV